MKKYFLLFLVFSGFNLMQIQAHTRDQATTIKKTGKTIIQERKVAYFNSLVINGPFELVLSQGSSVELKVEADEDVVNRVITNVKNNSLMIFSRETMKEAGPVKIHLTFVRLDQIRVSGSIKFESTQKLNFEALDFELTGAPAGNLYLEARSVKANITGAGTLRLHGSARMADINIGGACNLDARDFITEEFTATVGGSATAVIHVSKELIAKVRESGMLEYIGEPKITREVKGVGSLRRFESR